MIDVIIPTYKPGEEYAKLIEQLNRQTIKPDRIIVMNTEEKYYDNFMLGKKYNPKEYNVEVHHLSKREFDHGNTRNKGVKKSKADIFIMMTQDAMPADEMLIEELVKPFEDDEKIAVSYGRQMASTDSTTIEKLTRKYNYPSKSCVKSIDDVQKMQIKAYFCSNVCCAYKRDIFDELGGFVHKTIFNEDMIYAAKVINAGYKIAYSAEAKVYHSHNYTGKQQFKRNFDNGVSHRQYPEVFDGVKSEGEGKKMVFAVMKKLKANGETLKIPGYIWVSACKYMGFKLGEHYDKLPMWMVNRCTSNKSYFIH